MGYGVLFKFPDNFYRKDLFSFLPLLSFFFYFIAFSL